MHGLHLIRLHLNRDSRLALRAGSGVVDYCGATYSFMEFAILTTPIL